MNLLTLNLQYSMKDSKSYSMPTSWSPLTIIEQINDSEPTVGSKEKRVE